MTVISPPLGVTIITAEHRSRGGLNKPGRFVSDSATLVCSQCGKGPDETKFHKQGKRNGFQQPCGPCKYARLKAKKASQVNGQTISDPHNSRHAESGRKQVACPYPGCKFSGSYVDLNKHRKEHDEQLQNYR